MSLVVNFKRNIVVSSHITHLNIHLVPNSPSSLVVKRSSHPECKLVTATVRFNPTLHYFV